MHILRVAYHSNAHFKGDPKLKRTFKAGLPFKRIFKWSPTIQTHVSNVSHQSKTELKGGVPPFKPHFQGGPPLKRTV